MFPLLFIVLLSCASNIRSRKNATHSEVIFKGGIYKDETWSENLKLKRVSWFSEATMQYDILVNELKESSKFSVWLGRDKKYLNDCSKFYVAALYSHFRIGEGDAFLSAQFEKMGFVEKTIPDFEENFKAHNNYSDWRLYEYKVHGFCLPKSQAENSDIAISIPGYSTQTL